MNRIPILLTLPLAFLFPLQAQENEADKGIAAYFDRYWRSEEGKPRPPLTELPEVELSLISTERGSHYFRIKVINSTEEDLKYIPIPFLYHERLRAGRWEYNDDPLDCGLGLEFQWLKAGDSKVFHYGMEYDLPRQPLRSYFLFSTKDGASSFVPAAEFPLTDEFIRRWSDDIDYVPDDPEKFALWEKHMLAAVAFQKEQAPEEAVPKLASWVAQLAWESKESGRKEMDTAFQEAREALLSIPGHAVQIGEAIMQNMSDFPPNMRSRYFAALAQFPRPDTVRALGKLLENSECHEIQEIAIRTLEELGIINPLVGEDPPPLHDAEAKPHPLDWRERERLERKAREEALRLRLEAWRLWYRQVRAGTRTFSFAGDGTVYSLSGPAAAARAPGDAPPGSDRPPATRTD